MIGQGGHIIFTGVLSGDKGRGLQRTTGKDGTILGGMGKQNGFAGAVKAHFMLARHRTTPDGMNADFRLFPFFGAGMAAENGLGLGILYRIIEHQRRAAGGIHFLIMMLFHNFNIEIR